MNAPIERRRHPRVPVELEVLYEVNGNRFIATARDLSLGGLFLEADNPPAEGTEIVVQFQLDSEILRLLATVKCSHARHGCGVNFNALGVVAETTIKRYVEHQRAVLEKAEELLTR